jgi:hypothetical protein
LRAIKKEEYELRSTLVPALSVSLESERSLLHKSSKVGLMNQAPTQDKPSPYSRRVKLPQDVPGPSKMSQVSSLMM